MYTLFGSIPLVCKNFLLLYNCTSFIKSVTPWSSTIDCGIPFTSSGFAKSPPFNSPILAVASFIAASWKGLSFSVNSGSPCTPLRLIRSAFLSRTFIPLSSFSTVKLNLETYFALLAGSLIIAFPLNSDLTVSWLCPATTTLTSGFASAIPAALSPSPYSPFKLAWEVTT